MEPTEENAVTAAADRPLLTGRLVFRTGVALVLVGLLFLFRYSIQLGWFGPGARLALGALVSAGLVAVGLIAPRKAYGILLQGAGIAGAYATAWAAYGRYGLVDETTAFIQLAAVAASGIGLAVRARSDVLSAVGAIGAVSAPLLIGGSMTPAGELGYQAAILAMGAVLYLVRSWWITLATVALGAGAVLGLQILDAGHGRPGMLTAAVAGWWAAVWLVPVLARRLGVGADVPDDALAVAVFPVPVLAWSKLALIHDSEGAVAVAGAVLLAAIHLTVWKLAGELETGVLDLMLGLGFVGAGALTILDASVAVPIYLLVTLAVAVFGSRADDDVVAVVGLAAAVLALPVWGWTVVEPDGTGLAQATSSLMAPVVVAGAAVLMGGRRRVAVGSAGYGMALVWIAHVLGRLDPGWATAGLAVLGLGSVVAGRLGRNRLLTSAGVATAAVAVVKLVLSDLASADPALRVGLALGIGVALLAVGYWIGDTAVVVGSDDPQPDPDRDTFGETAGSGSGR